MQPLELVSVSNDKQWLVRTSEKIKNFVSRCLSVDLSAVGK